MTDSFEVSGKWWLAGTPDDQVSGVLSFSPDSGGSLVLVGALRSWLDEGQREQQGGSTTITFTQTTFDRSGTYPRINGVANGDAYTLDSCFRTQSTSFFGRDQGTETIHANRIFKGAIFENGEPLAWTGAAFGTRHLVNWVMTTGISEEWTDGPLNGEPRFRIEARDTPDISTTTTSGISVTLRHGIGIMGDLLTERSLTHNCWWRVDLPQRIGLDAIVDIASDIQDIVSIASNDAAAFDSMRLIHPDLYSENADGQRVPKLIELFVPWNKRGEDDDRVSSRKFLFSFDQFGGIEGVGRWLRVSEAHRGSLGRVMASRSAKSMFVSDRLLSCAAALEAFDRDRTGSKNSNFKTRMARCAAFAGSTFSNLVGDVAGWVQTIYSERNDIAHNLGLRPRTANTETYFLWQSLYWLFVLCMLRESDPPVIVWEKIEEYPEYLWLIPQIRSAM